MSQVGQKATFVLSFTTGAASTECSAVGRAPLAHLDRDAAQILAILRRNGFGQENFTASGRWCLAPGHLDDIATALLLATDTFCIGEFDDQPVRLDLNPDDMIVDEDCVLAMGCR
jgi:hypothetical protein